MMVTIGQGILLGLTVQAIVLVVLTSVLRVMVTVHDALVASSPSASGPASATDSMKKFREGYPKTFRRLAFRLLGLGVLTVVLHSAGIVGP